MDGKPGAGSPLLCRTLLACLLLLTGLNVKADTNTASSQQTLETPTHVPTEVFGSTDNAATAIPTVKTSVKTEMLTTNEILKNSGLSTDDTNSVNTITVGSDLTQTTVATSHNVWTSSNPSTKRPDNTSSSKSSTSKPSTSNSTEYTSGPTESTTQTVTTETPTPNPTKHTSGPTESSTVTATIETHNPNSTMPTSGPTESSTEPDTHSSATITGGTDQSGITKSTGITQSTTENITSTSKTVSPETTEPAPPQSEPTIGKTQTTSTTDITPEHNVELPRALSSGSVAAITVIVIVLVLLIFGGAAFWKIRHSSYGRLLEDQDYGSLGNYNNPLYDDS